MAGLNPDRDRQILPRWRSFETTLRLGELDSTRPRRTTGVYRDVLSSKIYDWSTHKTIGHAADLIGSAIVVGREAEVVDAARFLLKNEVDISPWITELAERVLRRSSGGADIDDESHQEMDDNIPHKIIRICRKALRDEPRNSVMCVDISRAYASLGLRNKAKQYMEMAIAMGPDNRFILRSGSRLWAHLGEIDKAHKTITKSERTRFDPWLLAAEIATSGALNRSPKFTKIARIMLTDRPHPPSHMSELASGLATLEMESGSIKKSRQLFNISLENPTENSVAQALWASRRDSRIEVDKCHLEVPKSFEAKSWMCFCNGEWRRVVEECRNWSSDQSFSSRPYILGSYVSAVALQKFSQGEQFAKDGLVVDPDDFVLWNNLTFARVNLGKFKAAERSIKMMEKTMTMKDDRRSVRHARAVWLATSGLLAFRTGKLDEGRAHYLESLEIAKREGDEALYTSALSFYAAEAWIAGMDDRQSIVDQAQRALRRKDDPTNRLLQHMLHQKIGRRGHVDGPAI